MSSFVQTAGWHETSNLRRSEIVHLNLVRRSCESSFFVCSIKMGYLSILKDKDDFNWEDQTRDQRDLVTQSIISIALGLIAFFTFCVRLS